MKRPGLLISSALLCLSLHAQEPELVLPIGHTGNINYAEFSPDGKYVITASEDGTAKLWNATHGDLLRDIKGHPLWLDMAKFSPNGKYIVTVCNNNTSKTWETRTGKLLGTLKGSTPENQLGNGGIWIYAAFSPDSKYVLTASDAELDKNRVKIWETVSGRLIKTLSLTPGLLQPWKAPPVFSPDSRSVIITPGNHTGLQWDIHAAKPAAVLKNYIPASDSDHFSPDRKYYFTIERNMGHSPVSTFVSLKDAKSGTTVILLPDTLSYTNTARFSPDGKLLVTGTNEQVAKIWEVNSGRLLAILGGHISPTGVASFSRDGKFLFPAPEDSLQSAWDLATGKPVNAFHIKKYTVSTDFNNWSGDGIDMTTTRNDSLSKTISRKGGLAAAFFDVAEISPDGKLVITAEGTWDSVARIWDAVSGKLVRTLKGHTGVVSSAHFSEDGRMIITAASDDTARIWETRTGRVLFKMDGHQTGTVTATFSPDAHYAVTTCGDNSIKLWDTRSKKLCYTLFIVDSTDYFGKIPSGYYQSSPGAAKLLHYVNAKLQVITFEQLDIKFNRPDKVLEAIGNTDTALIRSYKKAWQKRINKLGFDTALFKTGLQVPEAAFQNRDAIGYEQTTGKISLEIKATEDSLLLDRFNIWVNEVPLFGVRGISLKPKKSKAFDTTLTVTLTDGDNRIEISVTNTGGLESYRMPLDVKYIPPVKQTVRTRFIGIGIDRFADDRYNLQYSVKDIRDLSLKLKEKFGNDISIDTLFNEQVTVSNVQALKQKLAQTNENDKVIIAYSGHGLLSPDYDYYLSTYAVNFEKPEQNGLPYDELENLLDSIPARKKLMLIDACHSGEVDKEEGIAMNKTADSLGLSKGVILVGADRQKQLGLENSFELMQRLFVNVGKSTGATVISAAAGNQFALERGDLKNGVFTYSILETMKDHPSMKISELKKIVGERVEQLTNGLQKPTSRNETIAVDWEVW